MTKLYGLYIYLFSLPVINLDRFLKIRFILGSNFKNWGVIVSGILLNMFDKNRDVVILDVYYFSNITLLVK